MLTSDNYLGIVQIHLNLNYGFFSFKSMISLRMDSFHHSDKVDDRRDVLMYFLQNFVKHVGHGVAHVWVWGT